MTNNKMESWILEEVHEAAQDLYAISAIDQKSMREFDALCLPHASRQEARKKRQET